MAKAKVEKKDEKEKKDLVKKAVVVMTMKDPNTGREVIDFKLLEPQVRDEVASITVGLKAAFTDVRQGYLKIGALLDRAETILKPRKLWTAYLASFPNFQQAQAYRYINGYKLAKTHYPEAVLDVVLSTGMNIIGTKDRPYGKYQDIVKHLPPPKNADTDKALGWLNQVETAYRETRKKGAKLVDPDELAKITFGTITRNLGKLPDGKQLGWLRKVFGYVLHNMGVEQDETIIPKEPPADFVKKLGEKKVEETEDDSAE